MSKHTPGPWVYDRFAGNIGIRDTSDSQSFGMVSAIAYIDKYDHEEFEVNARLIAAAPDLLEALISVLGPDRGNSLVRDAYVSVNDCRKARAAIAKAKGDQQ